MKIKNFSDFNPCMGDDRAAVTKTRSHITALHHEDGV